MRSRPYLPSSRPRACSFARTTRGGAVALALAAAIVGVSCGGAASDPGVAAPVAESAPISAEPPATEVPTTTTTAPPPSPEEVEVRAVLDRFWPAYLEAISVPDPTNAVLVEILGGEAEIRTLGRFESMVRSHQRVVAPEPSAYAHHILSVTIPEAGQASVRECVVDDLQVIQDIQGTEEPMTALIDGDVVTAEITTSFVRDETGWLIMMRESTEVLQGIRDCEIFSP